MQAIILAAGMGVRLKELTKNNTKCMIEVGREKLIDRVLTQLLKCGVGKIIIVTGYFGDKLKSYVENRYPRNQIIFVHNQIYFKTNSIYSLSLVSEYLAQDDTILLESDLIFEEEILNRLLLDSHPNLSVVAQYEYWMNGTMVKLDMNNVITSFIPDKDFLYSDCKEYYKTVNIHKFSKEFSENKYIPFLKAYIEVFGYNNYYEEVLSVLSQLSRTDLKGMLVKNEKWYEIDDLQDYYIAQTLFSSENIQDNYYSYYGGYWRFPKLIDFCYLVNPFFPTQRMLDEIKHASNTLLTSYPSGSETNNRLAARMFDLNSNYVVLANGASELIRIILNNLTGNVGIILPTFEEYFNSLDKNRRVSYYLESEDFHYTSNDIKQYFENKNISCLVLINPDNPSGNLLKKQEVEDLLLWAKEREIFIILDESFIDFSGDESISCLNNITIQNNPHLILIKSISKSYGVPGARLGVLVSSNHTLIKKVKEYLPIWNINSYGEFFLQIYSKYISDYKEACQKFLSEREFFFKELQKISYLKVIPSKANYFLCEVVLKYSAQEIVRLLITQYNILVKDCSQKTGLQNTQYIRISIKNNLQNKQLLHALNILEHENDK